MKIKNSVFILCVLCFTFLLSSFVCAAYTSSYAEPSALLRKGTYGTGVKWLQDMLNHNGYNLTVDGVFGSGTYNAVVSFQSSKGLSVDGIVGSATRNALKNSSASSVYSTTVNSSMITTTGVNFRSGPSTNNSSYGVLASGTSVYVYNHRSDGWSYVKYNGTNGYIYTKYLASSGSSLPTFNRNSSSLINIIKNCKAYYANNNFYYSTAAGARSIPADNSKPFGSYGRYYTDCSCFTSWVLHEYARANGNTAMKNYFSTQKSSSVFASIGAAGGNSYLKVVDAKNGSDYVNLANAKVGDILVSPGHVEFFSSYTKGTGNKVSIKVYNCGSDASVKASGITTSATTNIADITYILRVK